MYVQIRQNVGGDFSNGFTANSLLYPCNTKSAIAISFCLWGGGGGGGLNKDFGWNCMYRLGKTFVAISVMALLRTVCFIPVIQNRRLSISFCLWGAGG